LAPSESSFLSFTFSDSHANAHFCKNFRLVPASVLSRSYFSSFLHDGFSFSMVISFGHFLTCMRMRILAQIFSFSWVPFSLDLTFPHLFIMFSHFQSVSPIWHFLTGVRILCESSFAQEGEVGLNSWRTESVGLLPQNSSLPLVDP
jgi:hypothetical protein